MCFRDKRKRVMFCSMLFILMFTIFSPNVQFQISVVHEGDWETVEYIDSISALQIEDPIMIEGELVHQEFIIAEDETNYVDAVQSQTYGTTTDFATGMTIDDDAHSTLQEASYVSTSYSTITSYTGGSLPGGWTNTDWTFGASYASITGIAETGGNFYTAQHDMSSYAGVRVKFDWRNDGNEDTEEGELVCNSYEGGNNEWFSSPSGNQGSYEDELRDSAWHSTGWRVTFTATGLTGDVESWEGFQVDNIYLQGKVDNTYYRFEAVYRFDSIIYVYGTERLYADFDASTSTENIKFYGGITTTPTTYLGTTLGAGADVDFDISSVLTNTPFYVKIVDSTQSGDGDQDSWLVDRLYIVVSNEAPDVTSPAEIVNLDDVDHLYARYKWYELNVTVSDADGYDDIYLVEIKVYTSIISGGNHLYNLEYWEDTNTFNEELAYHHDYIELDTSGSTHTKSGNEIKLTFKFKIEWAHTEEEDTIWETEVYDLFDHHFEDERQEYNIETRLEILDTFELDDEVGTQKRGSSDTIDGITASGKVVYYNSGVSPPYNYPTTAEVDVWVSCADVSGSPWSDASLFFGAFSMTVDSDDVVGLDTYWVYVVSEGTGSGGTKLNVTSIYDTYIADALTITITGPTDNRQNINANATGIIMSAVYDYGGAFDGTLTMNNTDYNGDGTVVRWGYTISSASGGVHGVTTISTNDETYMIWDQVYVVSLSYGGDTRVNVEASINFDWELHYDYDEVDVSTGTHTINGYALVYQGDGVWRYTNSSSLVGNLELDSIALGGDDTYGITEMFMNGESVEMIWDRIIILTTTVDDSRIDISTAAAIAVTAQLEYDSHALTDGDTLYMNNTAMSWNGSHFILDPNFALVDLWSFFVNSSSANEATYGITVINLDGNSVNVIWDRVEVYDITRSYAHYGLDANGGFVYYLRYDYNDEAFGDLVGYTFTSDTGSHVLTQHVSNFYYFTMSSYSQSTVTKDIMATLGSCDETTYGLTAWTSTADSISIIWDYVEVTDIAVSDSYLDAGDDIWIQCQFRFASRVYWADYDYVTGWAADAPKIAAPYTGGYAPMFSSDQGDGWWRVSSSFAPNNPGGPQNYVFNTSTMVTAGIGATGMSNTVFEINEHAQSVTWDQLICTITVGDNRININVNATIGMSATYQIGGGTYDGTLTLNYTTYEHATVQRQGYTIDSANGDDTHGITVIGTNDDDYVIWDQVYVVSLSYGGDTRVNVEASINFDWELHYDYDETDVTDGTITINDYACAHQGSGTWRYTNNSGLVGDLALDTIVVTGNTHGITVVNQNSKTVTMIWDKVIVMGYNTNSTDDRDDIGDCFNVSVWIQYEFDSTNVTDGTIVINGDSYAYNAGSGNWTALFSNATASDATWDTIVASGNTHGITYEDQNGKSQTAVWDSYTVSFTVDDNRININVNATVGFTVISDFDSIHYDGTRNLNYTTWEQSTAQRQGFTISSLSGDDTYGITTISSNDEDYVIWDSLTITLTDPSDQRININANASGMVVSAIRDFDSSVFDGSLNLNDTTYDHGTVDIYGYTVDTASGGTYGITAINSNDETYCIFDRIKILTTSATANFIERDVESTTVNVTAELDYDSHTLGTDDTLYMNNTEMTWDTDHFYITFGPYDVFWSWMLFVNSTDANEDSYGITVVWLNGQNDTVGTDRIIVISYAISDARDNVDDYIWTNVTVQYESDSAAVVDGTIVINGYDFSHLGSGIWRHNRTQVSAVGITFDSVVASGNTRGIAVVNQNGQSQLAIWDSYIVSFTVDDNRIDINVNATVEYTVLSEYDSLAYDGTITLNYTTWEQSTAQRQGFTVSSLGGDDTYGLTVIGTNDEDYIIWDSFTVDFTVGDHRIDINDNATVGYTVVSDYDSWAYDGTVTLNYSTWTQGSAGRWNFTVSSLDGDDTYGLTVIGTNDEDYMIWDSLTITADDPDDQRIDINDNMTAMGFTAVYDYDGAAYDGALTLNDTTYDHGTVDIYGYTVASADGDDTYGITAISSNDETYCIFDRIKILTTVVEDSRVDYNVQATITVTAELEYDSHALGTGDTLYMNDTSMSWNTTHFVLQPQFAMVDIWRFFVNSSSANEATYGITVIYLDSNNVDVIWDRIKILTTVATDGRIDYGAFTTVNVTAELEYDSHAVGSSDTLYMNNTLMTWDTDHFYITTGSYNIVDLINYFVNSSSANEVTYGITVINLDGNSANVIWDRIEVVVAVNMTWTVVNYYINVSYTGTYEHDSSTWSGYATVANTSLTTGDSVYYEEIVFSTVLNKTFYATAAEDAGGYGLTILGSTNTVWCVWDNMTASAMYGADVTEYSKTFIVLFGELKWQYNSSGIGADWVCYNIRNGTELTWATSLADNYLEPLKQEISIPLAWNVILYSNNATKTISGRYYNFQWFSVVQTVVLGQSVMVEGDEILDVTIVVSGTTNVDFTWTIYNELILTGETGSVSGENDWEISFSRNVTYGLYNFSIHFDAGLSGNRWYNSSYFNDFDLRIEIPEQVDDNIEIKGISSIDCEWRVYNRDTTTWTGESGTISGGNNYFHFLFVMQTATGKHNYSLYFNISVSIYIWKNGTYYIAPILLTISNPVYTATDEQNFLSGTTNIACDWYVYNNDTEMDTSSIGVGSFAIDWDKNTSAGYYIWGVKFDDGTTERWVNGTFEIAVIDLDIDIESWSAEVVVIEITGISNLDIAWYVYNEGVYSAGETGSETADIGFHFTFAKDATIGKHNFSIYFNDTVDGSQYRWFNRSYTISAVYGYSKITLYNSEGTGLADDAFIIYVNDTRYSDNEFYGRTDYDYNITVTDYFGYTIYSTTHDYDQHINIGIAFYVYKVHSEVQGQEIYFNLTRTGGARFSQHLLSDEILIYYLVAGEYTYEFRKVAHDLMVLTYIYYEGTFTLSCDKTHIIDGTNLRDLENAIELVPTGKTDIEPLETAMSGVMSMISMMQLGMWGLAFLIIVGMAATATEEEVMKDGTKVKKRKIPKQLKRFAFGKGAKNPKSKAIPKGAGRSSWKGVPFRDEVEDFRKKM